MWNSSLRQPEEVLPRELVSSLLENADAGPQNIVGSHTFAAEKNSRLK